MLSPPSPLPSPPPPRVAPRRRVRNIDEYNTVFAGSAIPSVPPTLGVFLPSGEGLLPTGVAALPSGEVGLPSGEVGIDDTPAAAVDVADASQEDDSQAASISDLDRAFITSANSSAAEDAPPPLIRSPRFASAPSSPTGPPVGPPKHPLLDGSLFFTPSPSGQGSSSAHEDNTESLPASGSSLNRTRREINLSERNLSEYDQSTPPKLASGEVDAEVVAGAEASAHAILDVSADGSGYVIRAGSDSIPIDRIDLSAALDEPRPLRGALPDDLPSTSAAAVLQRELRPKTRVRDERLRSSSNEAYPSARVDRAKDALRRNSEQAADGDVGSEIVQPNRHNLKGKDGRYKKKPPARE